MWRAAAWSVAVVWGVCACSGPAEVPPAGVPAGYSGYHMPAGVQMEDRQAIELAATAIRRRYGEEVYSSQLPLQTVHQPDGTWLVSGMRNKVTLEYARYKLGRQYTDAELMQKIASGEVRREGGYLAAVVDVKNGRVLSLDRKQ